MVRIITNEYKMANGGDFIHGDLVVAHLPCAKSHHRKIDNDKKISMQILRAAPKLILVFTWMGKSRLRAAYL